MTHIFFRELESIAHDDIIERLKYRLSGSTTWKISNKHYYPMMVHLHAAMLLFFFLKFIYMAYDYSYFHNLLHVNEIYHNFLISVPIERK